MFKKTLFFIFISLIYSLAYAGDSVTVFAASSLTLPLNEIVREYKKENNLNIILSYASSSSLARQLVYGAPADIYLSANETWIDFVAKNELITNRQKWLKNKLVLISSNDVELTSSFDLAKLKQLINNQHIAIADPKHVPLGMYSKTALEAYNLWQSIVERAVFTRNARATLALVERGEAAFGIVYYTDAIASSLSKIQYIFPVEKYTSIYYSKSLIKNASAKAQLFYHYLNSDSAKNILLKYGFQLSKK